MNANIERTIVESGNASRQKGGLMESSAGERKVAHVETDALDIAFEHGGPERGPFLLLLHGWPDDASTWRRVTPQLEAAGFRWAAPWLRGFGETAFRDGKTFRDGSAEALAQDALDFVAALGVVHFGVVGHDWGARIAYTLAAAIPDKLEGVAALSLGYAPNGIFEVPPFEQSRAWWYQWFMAVDPGRDKIVEDPIAFTRLLWDTWGPPGWYEPIEFKEAARSFANPDWLPITLHSYRSRWRPDDPRDPRYDDLRALVRETRILTTPTLLIQGLADSTVLSTSTEGKEAYFSGRYRRVALPDVGHFPMREAPDQIAGLVVEHFSRR
jgi:pimeloyl-ACP methyl ester carboxylesterase